MSAIKYTPADFAIKKLDGSTDLSEFDCSENDDLGLHEFLRKEALGYQNEGMGVTYLFYTDGKIAGYSTVAMGSVSVNSAKSAKATVNVRNYDKVRYPAVLLGRVAVDNKFRRKAVGSFICDWCVGLAQQLAMEIGCRFIVLVTKGESRVRFYQSCGFQECLISKSESLVPIEQRHRMMLRKLTITPT